MNFDKATICKSGITLRQWYNVLSSKEIYDAEFKTGVLLFFWSPGKWASGYLANKCWFYVWILSTVITSEKLKKKKKS